MAPDTSPPLSETKEGSDPSEILSKVISLVKARQEAAEIGDEIAALEARLSKVRRDVQVLSNSFLMGEKIELRIALLQEPLAQLSRLGVVSPGTPTVTLPGVNTDNPGVATASFPVAKIVDGQVLQLDSRQAAQSVVDVFTGIGWALIESDRGETSHGVSAHRSLNGMQLKFQAAMEALPAMLSGPQAVAPVADAVANAHAGSAVQAVFGG